MRLSKAMTVMAVIGKEPRSPVERFELECEKCLKYSEMINVYMKVVDPRYQFFRHRQLCLCLLKERENRNEIEWRNLCG